MGMEWNRRLPGQAEGCMFSSENKDDE